MKFIFRNKVEENFTVLRNSCIRDKELTWEARGVLHYLLSMPGDWQTSKADLIAQSPSAKDKVISRILKELETAGYIIRSKKQDKEGRWVWITFVCDLPVFQEDAMDEKMLEQIDEEMAAILGPEILERTRKIKEKGKQERLAQEELLMASAGAGENDPLSDYPPHVKDLLGSFMKVSQIQPTKRRKSDWIDTANEWREMGVKPFEVKDMYWYAREGGWDISRPGSITSAYYPMKQQSQKNALDDSGFRVAE